MSSQREGSEVSLPDVSAVSRRVIHIPQCSTRPTGLSIEHVVPCMVGHCITRKLVVTHSTDGGSRRERALSLATDVESGELGKCLISTWSHRARTPLHNQ